MQKLLSEAIVTAILAGKKILEFYGRTEYELKDDRSPITQADIASNELIIRHLSKIAPFPICTEESLISLQERSNNEFYWLVDPLDGTKDFLAQTDHFTVNIALMRKHYPIFGIIYIPALEKLYAGGEKFGFYGLRNENLKTFLDSPSWKKLNVLRYCQYSRLRLIGCDSKFHSSVEGLEFFKKYNLKKYIIGSSVKFCTLGLGLVDIYPRFNGSKEWDTAAGDAILRSVGGFLYDLKTQDILQYGKEDLKNNFFIAFAPILKNIYKDFLR
ncbi:3'(2'),5'-bisphosphate nucleotidase CysQ [uncultured Helicobacter sp.]|uniref:3'(2'),5'-bisphosphate nucleotidase CysQ family protein n=1 Tax=uncultured Helicobacter sp. TaxID=175537 RepID=UPI002624C77C|nr:3'(2'),5'-bisphosphate nucleotidase CysQ [uncultured Helicobacter sp.]